MDAHRAFERFVQKVALVGDCWLWTGAKPIAGHHYGQFRDEFMRRMQAHHFSYEFFVGPIPKGLLLDHVCRNEACVNPQHLEPVTTQENTLRGIHIVPCVHGKRARSHCAVCSKDYRRDRLRFLRGTVRTRERHKEPYTVVGVPIPNSLIEPLDRLADHGKTNRAAILRDLLKQHLSPTVVA